VRSIKCPYHESMYFTGVTRREAADKLEAHIQEFHAQEHEDKRFQNPQDRQGR